MIRALMRLEMVVMVLRVVRVDQSRPCAPYSSRAGWGDNGHPTVEWVRLQAARRLPREALVVERYEYHPS